MTRIAAAILLLAIGHGPAVAREPTPAQQAQQQRMRSCNADARSRNLTGEPRKGFMRECLRGRPPTAGTQAN